MNFLNIFNTKISAPVEISHVDGFKWSEEDRAKHAQKVQKSIDWLGEKYLMHPSNQVLINKKGNILNGK